MPEYNEYEFRVAGALASNPGLACFDDMNFFSMSKTGPEPDSAWDQAELGGKVEEAFDYDEGTVRVEVFQVALNASREQIVRQRPFSFLPAVRVVSKKALSYMPAADLITVDVFPLTRKVVLEAVKSHVMRTEYAKEQSQFLWGPDLITFREADAQN